MAVRQIPNLPVAVFVSPTAQLEIVQDGVSMRASAGQIGNLGANGGELSVVNDVTTPTVFYPVYLGVDQGYTNTAYVSNPHYLYYPLEGRLSAFHTESMQGISLNGSQITLNYTFPNGDNGISAGPVTVSAVVNVPTGSRWTIT